MSIKVSPTEQRILNAKAKELLQQHIEFDRSMLKNLATTVEKRKCTACGMTGKAESRLMMCKGCRSDRVRYCSEECQQTDWPNHRDACQKHIAFLKGLGSKGSKLYADVQEWMRLNTCVFDEAGSQVLLPSDEPHRLDTHLVVMLIEEVDEGNFDVANATVAPMETFVGLWKAAGQQESDLLEQLKPVRAAKYELVKRRRRHGASLVSSTSPVLGSLVTAIMVLQDGQMTIPPILRSVEVTEEFVKQRKDSVWLGMEHWENSIKMMCSGKSTTRKYLFNFHLRFKKEGDEFVPFFVPVKTP